MCLELLFHLVEALREPQRERRRVYRELSTEICPMIQQPCYRCGGGSSHKSRPVPEQPAPTGLTKLGEIQSLLGYSRAS